MEDRRASRSDTWPSWSFTRIGLLVGAPLAVVLGVNAISWAGAAIKTWNRGEVLSAGDLNAAFTAINTAMVDLDGDQVIRGHKTFTGGLKSASETDAFVSLETYNDVGNRQSYLFLDKARGTFNAPANVASGDELGRIYFRGRNGTGFDSSVMFRGFVDGAPGARVPGGLHIATNDATTPEQVRMTIRANGDIGIGTLNPTARLEVAGNAKVSGSLGIGHQVFIQSPANPGACTRPFSVGVHDCTCPAGTVVVTGGAEAPPGALLNCSRPIGAATWRVACLNTAGSPVDCQTISYTCARLAG